MEIIYGAAMMVETEMRVTDIQKLVFPHPTVCEVIREAIKNSVIEKSAYTEYLQGKTHLTKSDLLGMIVINTQVMEAIPKDLVGIIRNLYKVTIDINAIVKKLRIMEYYDLVDGYYKLFNQISDINKSLTAFINSYRNGKEVQL